MSPGVWVVIAAIVSGPTAIWLKQRIDARRANDNDDKEAAATLATTTENRVTRLFDEYDRLRAAYRSDMDDLRAQHREAIVRVSQLEHEVAEWRSGIHGVVGVWVAVPASVWDFVRDQLPDLPSTRFPGEREISGTTDS